MDRTEGYDAATHGDHIAALDDLMYGATRRRLVRIRYSYPAELDSMAAEAGLRRAYRWGGGVRAPLTADSGAHVSVYVRA